jgi:hypothetical protein
MNRRMITALAAAILATASLGGHAGENVTDQVESGEAGYKIGCSLANAMGIQTCGEMQSYHSMQLEAERRRQQVEAEARALAEQEAREKQRRNQQYNQ